MRELAFLRVAQLHVPGRLSSGDRGGRAVAEADDGDRVGRVGRVGDGDVVLRAGGRGVLAADGVDLVHVTRDVVQAHAQRPEDRVENALQLRESAVDRVADR